MGEELVMQPAPCAPPDTGAMAPTAPWKALILQSLHANKRLQNVKYLQIATVRPDGRPANRTVVYRGFLGDSDRLTFVTDARSRKATELAFNPWAEVAWYFPDSREQYRLLGKVTVVSKDGGGGGGEGLQRARLGAWRNMSAAGRQQFLWPEPGRPRGGDDDALFKPDRPATDGPVLDTFCLCVIDVEEVDHLNLGSNTRRMYKLRDGSWEEAYVNP